MAKRFTHSRKKGNMVIEGALFIIVLFVVVFTSYFGYKILTEMSPDIKADITNNASLDAINEVEDRYPAVFSGIIVIVLIGFWSFVIIAAFMSTEHPVMFIFSILLVVFVIIVSMVLGNFYEEFFSDAEYGTITSEFPIPHIIMSNMLQISLGILVSGLIVAFWRSKND